MFVVFLLLVDGTVSDDFTKELSDEVDVVRNNNEQRREYMTLQMIRSEERAEGHAEGRAEANKDNIKKFAQYLLKNGFASTRKEAMEKAKAAISQESNLYSDQPPLRACLGEAFC